MILARAISQYRSTPISAERPDNLKAGDMFCLAKNTDVPAIQPDQPLFDLRAPISGSQLADALVTLRNMARANVLSKEKVAYECERIVRIWERS
jgi:hypothetical protein